MTARPAAALLLAAALLAGGCTTGPTTAQPKAPKTAAADPSGGGGQGGGSSTDDDQGGEQPQAGESERLHDIVGDYESVLDAWYAAEDPGDLATAQAGALAYAAEMEPRLAELQAEQWSAGMADSAGSVVEVMSDALRSAVEAAAATSDDAYWAAVHGDYGDVGARTELAVLLLWV